MPKRFTHAVSTVQLSRRLGCGLATIILGMCQGIRSAPAAEAEEAKKVEPAPPPAISVRVSGIIKPELIYSTGVETFGKNTLVAPTAASHPIVDPNNEEWRQSFQLQQSRFGLHVGEGSGLEGHAEIDFIDAGFDKSSPIQASTLRLRLAYLKYALAEHHTLTAGQQWDIFSPLNPTMMNMVAVAFQSGNSAFLRPQFIYEYTGGPIEVAAAIGLRTQNTGPAVGNLEYGLLPTFSARLAYREGKTWVGVSAIAASLLTQGPPDKESTTTYAVNGFAQLALGEMVSLQLEGYFGKATGQLGLLTLGYGSTDLQDAGGWLSAVVKLAPEQSLWLTASAALALDEDDVALGYATADGAPATRTSINGIERNVGLRGTYVYSPRKGMEFYIEPFLFLTRHKLAPADDPNDSEADRTAFGTAVGTRLRF